METTMPYAKTALTENHFWLQIMGDHSRFIFYSMAPSETEYIITAQNFILLYDKLLNQSHSTLSEKELEALIKTANETTLRFREFKLELLSMSLASDLKSQLMPSFLNTMVNELDEYQHILSALQAGTIPQPHPLHYHMLWLSDAFIHSACITSGLDFTEKDQIDNSCRFQMQFQDLYLKALNMSGYLRTQQNSFPSLENLNNHATASMKAFTEYLEKLHDQCLDHKIPGTLMPLMMDHMSREGCYYLWKLSNCTSTIHIPDCDPARPRANP